MKALRFNDYLGLKLRTLEFKASALPNCHITPIQSYC